MTVTDMRCDRCATFLTGPAGGPGAAAGRGAVRFLYHPGDFALRDDSGLFCEPCATSVGAELGERLKNRCSSCGADVERTRSLFFYIGGNEDPWRLCPRHAAELLNTLRTVEPKLDPEGFTLAGDWPRTTGQEPTT